MQDCLYSPAHYDQLRHVVKEIVGKRIVTCTTPKGFQVCQIGHEFEVGNVCVTLACLKVSCKQLYILSELNLYPSRA
jgi:hypothetical protein